MKKTIIALLVLIVLIALVACGNKADKVARKFFDAMDKKDFTAAKQYASKQSQELLTFAEQFMKNLNEDQKGDMDDMKYNIVETKIEGETAIVTYEQWKKSDPGNKQSKTLNMVKEDGEWKVKLDKGNVGK
ncbi:MAG: DUF4878 domain-containing protein [Candidatus Cloacimonadaceae bacterium]|nr:DUF4878 domain-containing protein [Candidatus Cloacimonadaceae bacterium]MDP3114236.1 DUF4878 domain-containing protein [Candidatus Cloacimonadaceae bacterium]